MQEAKERICKIHWLIKIIVLFLLDFILCITINKLNSEEPHQTIIRVVEISLFSICIFYLLKDKRFFRFKIKDFTVQSFGYGLITILGFVWYFLCLDWMSENAFGYEYAFEFRYWIGRFLPTLLGAFVEEVVYRGFMLKYIEKECKSKNKKALAVVVSSIFFALMHYSALFSPSGYDFKERSYHVLLCLLVGIYLSIIYLLVKNIWGVTFLHAISNMMIYMFAEIAYNPCAIRPKEVNILCILGREFYMTENTMKTIICIIQVVFVLAIVLIKKNVNNNSKAEVE